MSEETSQDVFRFELMLIIIPFALLLLFATAIQIYLTINAPLLHNITILLFALVAGMAISSGIYISKIFIKHGSLGLQNLNSLLWIFPVLGGILVIASVFVSTLPHSPEYSAEESFRRAFDSFIFGIPLFVPFIHLLLEKFLRKRQEAL